MCKSITRICSMIRGLKAVRRAHRLPIQWRRFENITENEAERSRLDQVIRKHSLSRQDLAIILFGLRVRPGFSKRDFGI